MPNPGGSGRMSALGHLEGHWPAFGLITDATGGGEAKLTLVLEILGFKPRFSRGVVRKSNVLLLSLLICFCFEEFILL